MSGERSGEAPHVGGAWRALGASARGAAHARRGLPNQDALAWRPAGSAGLALAVADGHGSARHFRSGVGAELAAVLAVALAAHVVASELDWTATKRLAEEHWPQALTRQWQEAALAHWATNPPSEDEAARLTGDDPLAAYGTTLLCALATPDFLIYWQIGDGDLLAVSAGGEVARPLPPDPRCLGVETASLCAPGAALQFRVRFQALVGPPPALVLLATDGYGTSFESEAAFAQAGADFVALSRAEGPDAVQARLPDWLAETSEAGSGDDVTLGLLCHLPSLEN